MNKDTINMIIKAIFFSIFSAKIMLKLCNYKNINLRENFCILISVVALSCLSVILRINFDIVICTFITFFLQAFIMSKITNIHISNALIGNAIAISTSYILLVLASCLGYVFQLLFNIDNKSLNVIVTFIIEYVIIYLVLKIKKLKNGFQFLKRKNEHFQIILVSISMYVVVMYGLVGRAYSGVTKNIFLYFILLGFCLIITVQKILSMHYKQKLVDDTINDYKNQIQQKDAEIKNLTEENFKISKINHEFNHRQKSLETMINNHLKNIDTEAGSDNEILTRIRNLSEEHANKMGNLDIHKKLPTTGINEIDDMFSYMQKECTDSNIDFKLKINGNIYYMTNNLISISRLETLIGDHLRDAIIAINSSNNKQREILAILGQKECNYEFSVYDSGVDFDIHTLINLGKHPITTHKDTGGTGIGFITTFETLQECRASLEIEELKDNEYTKCVRIIFDGKNEYRIKSHRANEIKLADNHARIKLLG